MEPFNPWAVQSMEEFLYYCCPKCDNRSQTEDHFYVHAIKSHPESEEYLLPLRVKREESNEVKDEPGELSDNQMVKDESRDAANSYLEDEDFHYLMKQELHESGAFDDSEYFLDQTMSDDNVNTDLDYEYDDSYSDWSRPRDGVKRVKKKTKVKSDDGTSKKHITRTFDCFDKDCDYKTNKRRKVLEHLEVVHKTLESGTCLKCNKMISKTNSVQYIYLHMQSCYLETVNSCERCGKQFENKYTLAIHVKNVHNESPAECPECGKTFKNSHTLNAHMVVHKNDRKRFHCDLCKSDYGTKQALKNHVMRAHEGQDFKTHQCSTCGKKFESNARLLQHVNTKHNESFKGVTCDICQKTYMSEKTLETHKRLVHEKIRDYVCEICAKSFQTPAYLKHHIAAVHDGIRKFKCKLCEKSFAHEFGLKRHVSSFHEGKRYECSHCIRSFTQEYHLKQHIETSH